MSGLAEVAEEQEVDRLFGLGPESFVAARNEAARRLRKAGDAGAAARITALRRPSLSAWAVNQLARARGPQVEELLEAGQRLRAAHQEAVAGGGAAALRAATRAEREAVAGLVAAAVEVLESTGHATTEATRDRVAATLHAAAADPAAAELVRRGRLTHDLDPTGFGAPDADGLDAALEAWAGTEGAAAEAGAAGRRRGARATPKGRDATGRRGDGTASAAAAAAEAEAVAAARARRLAAVAARDEARRRARLAADQAVLATRHAERLGRVADQAEREATRARKTATAAIDAAAAARERASRAAKELTEAEGRLAKDG